MREHVVDQLHLADRIGVCHFDLYPVLPPFHLARFGVFHLLIFLLPFRAAARFLLDRGCQLILLLKKKLQCRHRRVHRPLPADARADQRQQHIRVVPDFHLLHLHLVVAGMNLSVPVQLVLQRVLHLAIRPFGGNQVIFLSGIRADDQRFKQRLRNRHTPGQAAEHVRHHHRKEQDDQLSPIFSNEHLDFPLRPLNGREHGFARALHDDPFRLPPGLRRRVLPLNLLFLPLLGHPPHAGFCALPARPRRLRRRFLLLPFRPQEAPRRPARRKARPPRFPCAAA